MIDSDNVFTRILNLIIIIRFLQHFSTLILLLFHFSLFSVIVSLTIINDLFIIYFLKALYSIMLKMWFEMCVEIHLPISSNIF